LTPDGQDADLLDADDTVLVAVSAKDLRPPAQGREIDLDRARKNFTWFVLIGFGLTILAALVSVFTGDWKAMLQVLERLLPAESAVVGATLGFYFISRPVSMS
jgi:hypothetical protein